MEEIGGEILLFNHSTKPEDIELFRSIDHHSLNSTKMFS